MSGVQASPSPPPAGAPDVVVIGTGPGGGMAACRLATRGLRVLVLEAACLPRHKACGGAMPAHVKQLLDWDFEALVEARIHQQLFLFDRRLPVRTPPSPQPMLLVSRSRFDHHLVQRAVELGHGSVELRDGCPVRGLEEDEGGVTVVCRSGERIRTRAVVAADGASTPCGRSLGLVRRKPGGAAIDAEVQVDPATFQAERSQVTFDLWCLPNGYGWIFPKGDHLSCGVGSWRTPRKLPAHMDRFLARSLPPGSIRHQVRRAHPVPVFTGHRAVATRRVCLVGDAAALVDPVLGEGIHHAIFSGALAAEVISLVLAARSPHEPLLDPRLRVRIQVPDGPLWQALGTVRDCRLYTELIRYSVGRELNLIRLRSAAFFDAPERFYRSWTGAA